MSELARWPLHGGVRALVAMAALLLSAVAWSVTVVDDRGVPVTLPHPPARIVTLSPHLAEVAYAGRGR